VPAIGRAVDPQAAAAGQFVRVEDMLAGRIAGLEVLRGTDGRLSLRVRGMGSNLNSAGGPLLVLDGMAITGDPSDVLAGLSPLDIQRVEVLKDASTTALYGSRGSHGVLVITTKRAR
jgi:TonB-dependent SusC/RagA subfamily outer membrane receptor